MTADRSSASFSARLPLCGTGVEVSRLGFGTATLMSRVNRRNSLALLHSALEAGITHFDTARSYGFGDAEAVLGEFLQGRREPVTVTTKVGMLPPRRRRWLSLAKAGARGLVGAFPGARPLLHSQAARWVPEARFDDPAMSASLDTSLRELRTDYVDFLLLHEPRMEDLRSGEALAFLERMQASGKVRHFGVATNSPGMLRVLSDAPSLGAVLQFPRNLLTQVSLPEAGRGAGFVHGCLGAPFEVLRGQLAADRALAERWSRALGVDLSAPGVLACLTLQAAMVALPQSAVLFASTKPAHVRENAAALGAAATLAQVETWMNLVREHAAVS